MRKSPKDIAAKLKKILNAWKDLQPTKTFGGMTYDQFAAKVQPSFAARQEITDLQIALLAAQDRRDDADKVSRAAAELAVNGVKGHPDCGEDSAVYETMGYIRKSQRATGKTNRRPAAPAPAA